MNLTEDEAKTKWCPKTQVVMDSFGVLATNRLPGTGEPDGLPVCIGSACMMWRWAGPPPDTNWGEGARKGYCGLAGKPEGGRES